MTKKSDKAAAKFFTDFGNGFVKGSSSVVGGATNTFMDVISLPFDMVSGGIEDITSGPSMILLIGGGALVLVLMMNSGSRRY